MQYAAAHLSLPLLGLPGLVLAFHIDAEGRAQELKVEQPLPPPPAALQPRR
jgi:hypothetical protein